MACMTGAERRKLGLMVGSWCCFAIFFNICLRAKVRVMKNLRRCVDMHG